MHKKLTHLSSLAVNSNKNRTVGQYNIIQEDGIASLCNCDW